MRRTIADFLADLLEDHGSAVDKNPDGSLEVVVPSDVSRMLRIPEHTRLGFSCDTPPHDVKTGPGGDPDAVVDTVYAGYDSDLFGYFAGLLAGKGALSLARLDNVPFPGAEKLSKMASEKIVLANGTFRLGETEMRDVSYLLTYFKYSALSDEKQEGILPVAINEINLSAQSLDLEIEGLAEVRDEPAGVEKHSLNRVIGSAHRAGAAILKDRLTDFANSLQRRLNRDISRVYDYYQSLSAEVKAARRRQAAVPDKLLETAPGQTEESAVEGSGPDKLLEKLRAIELERDWKVRDLISKYTLTIELEPVAAVRVYAHVPTLWINLKRRLAERRLMLTYDPLVRQLDPLPCESCFHPQGAYYLCDDRLHLLCGGCFPRCASCGKRYCRACRAGGCPKCGRA